MEEVKEFPHLLVVDGSPLSPSSNMGILKCHLLKNWPCDNISHLVTSGLIDPNSIAKNQFIITKKGILSGKSGFSFSKNISTSSNQSLPYQSRRNTIREFFRSIVYKLSFNLYKISKPITHLLRSSNSILSTNLESFIKQSTPNIILTFGVTLPELKLAYTISQKYKIPLIMYITDDYISSTYKDTFWSGYLRRKFESYYLNCIHTSIARFTVCKKMEIEYTERYKTKFITVMDGIDISKYITIAQEKPAKIHNIRLYYIGSLEPDRWINILAIGEAITQLNTLNEIRFELIIHASKSDQIKYGKKYRKYDSITFNDPVPFDQVPLLQSKADILIHVESFNEFTSNSMTKYSMSTKIFQYLASGTPIFAFAPPNISSMEFLEELNAGIRVDKMDLELVKSKLLFMVKNMPSLLLNASKNKSYALKNLTIDASCSKFAREILAVYKS